MEINILTSSEVHSSAALSSDVTVQTEGQRALNVLLEKRSDASWWWRCPCLLPFCIFFRHTGKQASYVSLVVEGVVLVFQP